MSVTLAVEARMGLPVKDRDEKVSLNIEPFIDGGEGVAMAASKPFRCGIGVPDEE